MKDSSWLEVALLADIPRGKTLCVELSGKEVLLCHTSEGVFAVDNLCSHAEARLCEGKLKGKKILCPLHGAAFDVASGEALSRPASKPLACFTVKLDGARILLQSDA
jgi:nitrite reductase/ring-hydroxylating ferredoxin subunit